MVKKISELKVEHDIPVPHCGRGRRYGSSVREILRQMKPGDSFFWPGAKASAYTAAFLERVQVAVRLEGDGYRVWLIGPRDA